MRQVRRSPAVVAYANWLVAEERCLRVLNAPLLKNKLPEHIRERVLGYKEAIGLIRRSQGLQVEGWLANMT